MLCAGLENDEYTRKTDGYLPTAEVAFIDEIFKANSAILNALLTLLNERLFDNGNQRLEVPLLCLVSLAALLLIPVLYLMCWLLPFDGMKRHPCSVFDGVACSLVMACKDKPVRCLMVLVVPFQRHEKASLIHV